MRMVVSALIDSIPHLISVACVLMMFILVFAILGLQMFEGLLFNRCRLTPQPNSEDFWPIDDNNFKLCGYKSCGK